MTTQEMKDYISGRTPRTHAVNPFVEHGEIKAPALLKSTSSTVVFAKPTDAGRRCV